MIKDYFCIQVRQSVQLALPLENVIDVITLNWEKIYPIPGVAAALLGVVNQRGRLLWVLELGDLLSQLLGLTPSPIRYRVGERLKLLTITLNPVEQMPSEDSRQIACVVSELKGVVSLDTDNIKPIPTNLTPSFNSFLSGVAVIKNLPVALLNVPAIFATLRILTP
ncbi:MAG: chemotaxis protein CheW [Oscillatoriaceae bacterium SKW80]|nr:chemotaxis protein CheW [Oscillatoriaceae bacterium SKYG93]MCX8121421.1 chemotaxis protein CheW [Oscillatoriaceae bacterium SKW80]MDW8451902.1 chemotaxis protein CheW [Oscillatoriaceae cyanobacterium SKYGB_i_bin93]HIK29445.1 chemotaxis protein CheW [Oscillatoriaceae cyanobacterium M7585_C2015_266]